MLSWTERLDFFLNGKHAPIIVVSNSEVKSAKCKMHTVPLYAGQAWAVSKPAEISNGSRNMLSQEHAENKSYGWTERCKRQSFKKYLKTVN